VTNEERVDGHESAAVWASMWRSRNSGLKRSRAAACSSFRCTTRSAEAFSSHISRSYLPSRPWQLHTPRPPLDEAWMPHSASSPATRRAP
jgi:hypothetical protein